MDEASRATCPRSSCTCGQPRHCGRSAQGSSAPAAQPRLRGRGFMGKASRVRLCGGRVQGPSAPAAQPRLRGRCVQRCPHLQLCQDLHQWHDHRQVLPDSCGHRRTISLLSSSSRPLEALCSSSRPSIRYRHHQGFPAPAEMCPRLLCTRSCIQGLPASYALHLPCSCLRLCCVTRGLLSLSPQCVQ